MLEEQFAGEEVPRPPFWNGYVLSPVMVEFWWQREFRLHDRFLYTLGDEGWTRQRLSP